jgi:hypothetical protein
MRWSLFGDYLEIYLMNFMDFWLNYEKNKKCILDVLDGFYFWLLYVVANRNSITIFFPSCPFFWGRGPVVRFRV